MTVDTARAVTATFARLITASVTTSGVGTVSSQPRGISGTGGSAQFPVGFPVTLTALPPPGGRFSSWSGVCSGSTAPTCTFTPSANVSALARFDPGLGGVSVRKAGTGTGFVVSQPDQLVNCGPGCDAAYPLGTTVRLYAIPDPGSRFGSWSGACTATSTMCEVTLKEARTLIATATFLSP